MISSESSFCNALSLSSTALLAERCGRVVTSAAEEVVGIVYMAFIDDLSYQGSGSTETMSAATRKNLSLALCKAKHSPGFVSAPAAFRPWDG